MLGGEETKRVKNGAGFCNGRRFFLEKYSKLFCVWCSILHVLGGLVERNGKPLNFISRFALNGLRGLKNIQT